MEGQRYVGRRTWLFDDPQEGRTVGGRKKRRHKNMRKERVQDNLTKLSTTILQLNKNSMRMKVLVKFALALL